ncbi:transglutaminaseTgpA domain-containing protein [Microcella sp.]|uniref:transglutaminaseTgpA domain-containing protein n=1 Tax=Microcella sp. TaxID=1913979 RepID=UPI00391D0FE8
MSSSGRPARRSLPRPAVLASILLFTIAAWAVVAVAWWPVYRDPGFLVVAAVAIPLGCALAVVASALRWPAWGLMIAVAAALVVVGVPLAVPSRALYGVLPEPEGLLELLSAVALGWTRLVTIDLPVGTYQSLLVPALVSLVAGSAATVAVALRARYALAAVAIPAVAYPVVLAFGPDRAVWPIATTLALLLVLLLWLAVWRRHRRTDALAGSADRGRGGAVRQFGAAVLVVLLAGGAGVALIALLPPPDERTVLRTIVEQPFDPFATPSPLAAYRASFQPERADDIVVIAEGLPDGERVRIAVLDSYDGVVFAVGSDSVDSASGRFVRVPARRDIDPGARVVPVEFTLGRAFGPWLPSTGQLVDITVRGEDAPAVRDRVVYNAVTDSAVLVGGAPSGLRYRIESVPLFDEAGELTGLTPGAAAVPAIVNVPDELRDWLSPTVQSVEGAGARLAAIVDRLTTDGYLSHGVDEDEAPSRPGHSIDRLDELVSSTPMVGDAEQYAALAALAARELGFPSRVVLGFVEGVRDERGAVPADPAAFRDRDLTAWIEVSTAERGWVPIDVVPPRREVPPPDSDETTPITRPQPAVQPPLEDAPPPDEQAPPDVDLDERDDEVGLDPLLLLALQIGAALLGLIMLALTPVLAILAVKARRRRRRRRARDPATRILAGWMQVVDDVVDRGVTVPPTGTRRERAAAIGAPSVVVLARVADRAVYAPDEPSPEDATKVWGAVDAVRRTFQDSATRRERMRAAVSTRSLRRYPVDSRRRQRKERG